MSTACILSVAALLLGGCTQNDLPGTDGADGSAYGLADLRITSALLKTPEAQPVSRAVATDVLTTGSIGLFRSKGTGYAETQDNKKYTYDATKGWQPAAAADTVYLMANDADVCAYYPYNAAYTDKTAIPLASGKYTGTADDLTKHDPADLCYAAHRAMNGATASTELVMQHAMALVQLTFERDNYASTACNLTSVSIKNKELISTSTVNITDGTYGTTPAKAALKWTPGEGASATGIQVPQTGSVSTSALLVPCTLDAAGSTTFSFTVDGQTMSAKVPAARLAALEAGKIHKLKFLVHAASITLSEVSIVDWWREWETANEPTVDAGTKDYIELAGVKWAIADLTYNPTHYTYSFASSAVVSGTKMQWNALTAATDAGNKTPAWLDYQDPCTRIEPKGTWVTPRKEDVDSLLTVPRAWTANYQGVKGWWFGINDAAKAADSPDRYLFLSAGSGTAGYWTQTYGTQNNPQSFWLMSSQLIEEDLVAYNTPLNVRCIKKPKKIYQPIDIGLPFLIAPGNLIATADGAGGYTYDFTDEQGTYTADLSGGDYFIWHSADPTGENTDNIDPCSKVAYEGKSWRTPTSDELHALANADNVWGTWTKSDGTSVNGRYFGVTGVPDVSIRNSVVFLPAAGYEEYDYGNKVNKFYNGNLTGSYWSNSDSDSGLTEGDALWFDENEVKVYGFWKMHDDGENGIFALMVYQRSLRCICDK